MNLKKIGLGAAALASATTLGFTATAHAAAPVNEVPTADYKVCGNVYAGAWVENNVPPATATALENVDVKGELFNSSDSLVMSQTATTNSTGGYCITGDSSLVSTVINGGYVKLTLDTATLPAGHTTLASGSSNPWKSSGFFGSNKIGVGTFLAHKVSGLESAYQFHFATN